MLKLILPIYYLNGLAKEVKVTSFSISETIHKKSNKLEAEDFLWTLGRIFSVSDVDKEHEFTSHNDKTLTLIQESGHCINLMGLTNCLWNSFIPLSLFPWCFPASIVGRLFNKLRQFIPIGLSVVVVGLSFLFNPGSLKVYRS